MPGKKGKEYMEERKTFYINPKAICNHCYYAHSCEEVLRGLEILGAVCTGVHTKTELKDSIMRSSSSFFKGSTATFSF